MLTAIQKFRAKFQRKKSGIKAILVGGGWVSSRPFYQEITLVKNLLRDLCFSRFNFVKHCSFFRSLDRETVSEYTFFVVATDGGQDVVRSSSSKVTILVTDANDHTPGITNVLLKLALIITHSPQCTVMLCHSFLRVGENISLLHFTVPSFEFLLCLSVFLCPLLS